MEHVMSKEDLVHQDSDTSSDVSHAELGHHATILSEIRPILVEARYKVDAEN